MTDDLRTRIAAVLKSYGLSDQYSDPLPEEELSDIAEAVIVELQLTQQYLVDGIISDGEPRPWEVPCETRWTTEWEPFDA